MIKRMSILVRRPADDRATFSRYWTSVHGGLVSQLPGIDGYVQNHVLEAFNPDGAPAPFHADGFVELLFDDDATMQSAFSGEPARALLRDEPNFLGHATGYVLAGAATIREAEDGNKLIIALAHAGERDVVDAMAQEAASRPGCLAVIRDDVVTIVPKVGMSVGPQIVDTFIHIVFETTEQAQQAGPYLAALPPRGAARVGIYRVRTTTIIRPRAV